MSSSTNTFLPSGAGSASTADAAPAPSPHGRSTTDQARGSDSVLLVLVSDVYDDADYVRDYDEFLRLTAP